MAAKGVQNVGLSKLQSLNGILAIYKKCGPTSADVLNNFKEALLKEAGIANPNPRKRKKQALKIGHGGTLDSAASGVLVVGIGDGTKMLTTMLAGSKKYTAIGELGKATDTHDATGAVVQEKSYDHVTRESLEEHLQKFTGDIMQVPPLYSALKKDGQRLSVLLKKGQEVEAKPARPVTVYNLTVTDFSPPLFTLDIECGGGFYVRSLVDDLGKALSSCAHVRELVRTKQGQFTLDEDTLREERWTVEDISAALQPCPPPPPSAKHQGGPHNKHKPTPGGPDTLAKPETDSTDGPKQADSNKADPEADKPSPDGIAAPKSTDDKPTPNSGPENRNSTNKNNSSTLSETNNSSSSSNDNSIIHKAAAQPSTPEKAAEGKDQAEQANGKD